MQSQGSKNSICISAVIPAYNAEKYITRAIDSVLNQIRPVDEIIIVDDGSTDNTAEVIKRYGDKVQCIYQENAGVSAARNTGIKAAATDWIAFLDADDEWLPERIQLQVELLKRNSDLVWVSGNYIRCLCDENLSRPHVSESAAMDALNGTDCFENFFAAYRKSIWGCTDTMLIKKSVLEEMELFREDLRKMEDIDLFWKIARSHPKIGYVSQPIAIYHLEVAGSLIQGPTDYADYRDVLRKHLDASKGTANELFVTNCSRTMLKRWIRSMLFDKQADEIRQMLHSFTDILSAGYILIIDALTVCPTLTAFLLRSLSFVIRRLKIRRTLTRKPGKVE